ncbi:MAG: hypothetical protein QW802_04970, partial [Candidatus Altiarchaeota archaeon]
SLKRGNYTMIRELEVDPEQVWLSYAHGPIGNITVLEDNFEPLINVTMPELLEQEKEALTMAIPTEEKKEPYVIQILLPITTTQQITTTTEKRAKVIAALAKSAKERESWKLNLDLYTVLPVAITALLILFILIEKKKSKGGEQMKDKWYNK